MAAFILANPPCNIFDRGGECLRSDKRWQYGVPSADNWLTRSETTVGSFSS